ncbi:hypothetical protein VF04_22850 [Nostoc linckia z7]|uniref:CopG-like ribbon-helix-helix domain-containing protein n=1 Tax=Nostoc linckia z7 TaxID=1628745 RepID=A0ABX4KJI6_NOSLI|nr:ribbon-helix-helix protein, CopG family [Nostoc linckia]PHJ94353.1 hypothetical protein VF04_22850 [Nostoc linckia z7]
MGKVTLSIYMEEEDKEALQQLADAEERSLSQMAVLILKRAIRRTYRLRWRSERQASTSSRIQQAYS